VVEYDGPGWRTGGGCGDDGVGCVVMAIVRATGWLGGLVGQRRGTRVCNG